MAQASRRSSAKETVLKPGAARAFKAPQIPDKVFFRIGEVARLLGVATSVLRYWETEFPALAPQKSVSNQRVYRRGEVEALFKVRHLLYVEKYSIEGARRRLGTKDGAGGSALDPEKVAQLREMAEGLGRVARTPIARLFHL
jgi:DNA-binding transcriptional MerR regulator